MKNWMPYTNTDYEITLYHGFALTNGTGDGLSPFQTIPVRAFTSVEAMRAHDQREQEREMAKETRIEILVDQTGSNGPIVVSGRLDDVIRSFLRVRRSIPPEHRETTACEISAGTEYEWGESYGRLEIGVRYERPLTQAELDARVWGQQAHERYLAAEAARQRGADMECELAEYRRLKAKYGAQS